MRIWDAMPENVKDRILGLVRITGLQTYLLNHSLTHKSFSLAKLASLFGLDTSRVNSIICRYLLAGELMGKIKGDLFLPAVADVSKIATVTKSLQDNISRLEFVHADSVSSGDSLPEEAKQVIAAIIAQLNPQPLPNQAFQPEIGARRVRGQKVGLANAKALAASQQAAERRIQASVARRRGWDNARQPLQGTVISTERKRVFGKSYGY